MEPPECLFRSYSESVLTEKHDPFLCEPEQQTLSEFMRSSSSFSSQTYLHIYIL